MITRYYFIKKKICFVRLFNKIVMFSQANRDDRLRIFYVYLANRLKASRVCSSYRIMYPGVYGITTFQT